MRFSVLWKTAFACLLAMALPIAARAQPVSKLRIDYASYNPVSLVLKDKGLLEAEFAKDNIAIEWVQSAGSNKALERDRFRLSRTRPAENS